MKKGNYSFTDYYFLSLVIYVQEENFSYDHNLESKEGYQLKFGIHV